MSNIRPSGPIFPDAKQYYTATAQPCQHIFLFVFRDFSPETGNRLQCERRPTAQPAHNTSPNTDSQEDFTPAVNNFFWDWPLAGVSHDFKCRNKPDSVCRALAYCKVFSLCFGTRFSSRSGQRDSVLWNNSNGRIAAASRPWKGCRIALNQNPPHSGHSPGRAVSVSWRTRRRATASGQENLRADMPHDPNRQV